jgi:hypothetical protein
MSPAEIHARRWKILGVLSLSLRAMGIGLVVAAAVAAVTSVAVGHFLPGRGGESARILVGHSSHLRDDFGADARSS